MFWKSYPPWEQKKACPIATRSSPYSVLDTSAKKMLRILPTTTYASVLNQRLTRFHHEASRLQSARVPYWIAYTDNRCIA